MYRHFLKTFKKKYYGNHNNSLSSVSDLSETCRNLGFNLVATLWAYQLFFLKTFKDQRYKEQKNCRKNEKNYPGPGYPPYLVNFVHFPFIIAL